MSDGIVSLFGELLLGYVTSGWPFFVAHLVLAILFVRWVRREVQSESEALREWEARREPGEDPSETIGLLAQFTTDCRELGEQSFLVPIGDYTDRLDSVIEGKIAGLYDRSNAFLLVGIAGSLFGLFEFAAQAEISKVDSVDSVLELLVASMEKAFPVGFIGLVLTLFFQMYASRPERRLRAALAGAITKALKFRGQLARSQAQVVQTAAESIREAMLPLADLQETLGESLQPVVAEFGGKMERTLKLYEEQFGDLTSATGEIHTAVSGVQANLEILQSTSKSLDQTLRTAPAVLQQSLEFQRSQQEALQKLTDASDTAFGKLHNSLTSFEEHLDRVSTSYQTHLQGLASAMVEQSARLEKNAEEASARLDAAITAQSTASFEAVRSGFDEIRSRSLETAESIRAEMAAAAASLMKVEELPAKLGAEIELHLRRVGEESLSGLSAGIESMVGGFDESLRHLAQRERELIDQAGESMNEVLRSVRSDVGALLEATQEQAEALLRDFRNRLGASLQEVGEAVGAGITSLDQKASHAGNELAKMAKIPEQLSRGLDSTLRNLFEENSKAAQAAFASLLKEFDTRVVGLVDHAKESAEETRAIIRDLARSLEKTQQAAEEMMQRLEAGANSMVGESVGAWKDATKDFSSKLVTAIAALERLDAMPDQTQLRLDETLSTVRADAERLLEAETAVFFSTIKNDLLNRLLSLDAAAGRVGEKLVAASESWESASHTTADSLRDMIGGAKTQVVEAASELNDVLGERYPGAVRDVERLTQQLQTMVDSLEAVQKEFGETLQEARDARAEIRQMREEAAVAEAADPAPIGTSTRDTKGEGVAGEERKRGFLGRAWQGIRKVLSTEILPSRRSTETSELDADETDRVGSKAKGVGDVDGDGLGGDR